MSNLLSGRCVCDKVQFIVKLGPSDEPRTTLCHCSSCKRAFGTNFGLTTKIPLQAFSYSCGEIKTFKQDNGVTREFCAECGTHLCEYGERAADKFRYILWGVFDQREKVPPKGEFFCSQRENWMPEIPGTFRKNEIIE
ncbi:Mss4-like protein [Emericellopsis atlantica]|uniref:Mss4-like protein n=1 Tax=Emericellopsis atlantica TaxID=2614577 RepID=A0A9P8CP98_9HYPO|nr:Mss4-like protein [Emericellopsis atlantica]KAG9253962.1 Mss4-like protein [Emericellopsis atlantica]